MWFLLYYVFILKVASGHARGKPCHSYTRFRVASHAVAESIGVTGLAPGMLPIRL